ncbi:hypothetical protein [Microbacterium panaciterrae]|uniref:DUF4175 domain-containing protein n=1 Tax=Microbacterium panaciterrae TaxID=985759 RepID=A0ABP8PR21_9MICO
MYGALWRILPGPWWVRLIILLVLVAAILYGLFFYVFPWVSPFLSPGDVSILPSPSPSHT